MSYNDTIQRLTRAQRHGSHGSAAKDMLRLLALVGMGASAIYWWNVQSTLTQNRAIAIAFTAILVLAPPTLVSFLIPWSPGGMLLQKVNARTWGSVAVVGCALYLIYYSYQIQWSWWQAQPVVAESGMTMQQVLVGIIGFIIIPALLWAPVSDDELRESLKQAHLVKRYELQTQADIAMLQVTLLRAQEKAAVGLANLLPAEKAELAGVMQGIIGGIDRTIQEMAGNLNNASTTVYGDAGRGVFGAPAFSDDLGELLEYVATALEDSRMGVADDRALVLSSPHVDSRLQSLIPRATPRDEPREPHDDRPAHVDSRSGSSIPRGAPRGEAHDLPGAHVDSRPGSSIPRGEQGATRRHTASYDDAYARAAQVAFVVRPWTVKQLAAELDIGETTAREMRDAWLTAGWVREANQLGRWYFDINENEGGR